MKRLEAISRKDVRIAVGLISGTSADGVDAAVVRIKGSGESLTLKVLHSSTLAYPDELRGRALAAASLTAPDVAELHFELGWIFAGAALKAIEAAGLKPADVDVLGSHGQTVCHAPPGQQENYRNSNPEEGSIPGRGLGTANCRECPSGATLQLGDGCVLAHATDIVTVSDFRAADMAAGGQGAPLAPYLDWALFGKLEGPTVALNLGGIANITIVPGVEDLPAGKGLEKVVGFDTGPANMVLDGLAHRLLPGAPPCDKDGKAAAHGDVIQPLLDRLLANPYFKKSPPKSSGREDFGDEYVEEFIKLGEGHPVEDLLATAAALSAATVAAAVNAVMDPSLYPPARIVVSGGGIHNCPLMAMLAELFYPIPLQSSAAFGVSAGGKEAVLFALLAAETLSGKATSLPAVTGSATPGVLGKISLPSD